MCSVPCLLIRHRWREFFSLDCETQLCNNVIQCQDKSRTPSQKQDKWENYFFQDVIKNWDCPGKSGMDSHFILNSVLTPFEWWDVGMVIWDDVQTCIWPSRCQCHSLSLAPVNPDWFYLPGFYLSGTCSPE